MSLSWLSKTRSNDETIVTGQGVFSVVPFQSRDMGCWFPLLVHSCAGMDIPGKDWTDLTMQVFNWDPMLDVLD